jgi:hypothetical protein
MGDIITKLQSIKISFRIYSYMTWYAISMSTKNKHATSSERINYMTLINESVHTSDEHRYWRYFCS